MLAWTRRVAPYRFPVLVQGESGTGKELVARAVHGWSERAAGPFVGLNCAAVPEALIEAELFGVARGAFTGAERDRPGLCQLAHRGTLLLDEVADMPLSMQAKLLRVLQEGALRVLGGREERHVDVRIVAATHRRLIEACRAGRFREDLYYRLAVVEIDVPPLRSRPEDVELLARHFLERYADEHRRSPPLLHPQAARALRSHPWPGNVRELQAVLARALLRCDGGTIRLEDLGPLGPEPGGCAGRPAANLEIEMIERALALERGNVAGAARRIGWSRQKLYRRMGALGVRR